MRGVSHRSSRLLCQVVHATALAASGVALLLAGVVSAAAQAPQVSPPPPADFMRRCGYELWYPWYVKNQSKRPGDPELPRPEPDGPRDPVGEKCLEHLRQALRTAGRAQPGNAEILELRAAAKAGKAAALFQAFEELKASKQKP